MNARLVPWASAALLNLAACGEPADDRSAAAAAPPPETPEQREDEAEGAASCEVPSEASALLAYLERGDYKSFASESAPHASSGPHGGRVLTYVNDVLARSLDAGSAQHPRCAASIKELFLRGDEVSGWAVFVKTEADSRDGDGYYWLETVSRAPGRKPDYAAQGAAVCTGCHSRGRDYFRAPWPLQ